MSEAAFPWWFLGFFLAGWLLISIFIAYMSGWHALAAAYPCPLHFTGERFHLRSARCRWLTHYSMCLTFGANAEGLYLAVLPLYRFGHPPAFVPWPEVSSARDRALWLGGTRLTFARAPGVWFSISQSLGSRLLAFSAARSFPVTAA